MTIGEQLGLMMRQDSTFSDAEMASQAQFLDDVRWKMQQLANTEGDKFKPDEFLRGEAMAIGETMVKSVDGDDVYGVRWSPDQKGYKTGAEYKAAMLKLWNTPDEFIDHSFDDFRKLDRAGQLAEAMKDISPVKRAMHEVGEFVDDHVVAGGVLGLTPSVASLNSDETKAARQKAWEDGIIRKHEAKLSKRNAWIELSSISSYLQGDAKTVVDALLESRDNAVPTELYATFNRLTDDEKTLVCRARELMKPAWDGESVGTIAHDMAAGLVNLAERLRTAPGEQAVKAAAIAANGLFDAGIDVNKIARDRQYLWQATGRMFADGAGGGEPLGMFEQRCEEHGIIGDVLIGTVTTLPYMAAAAVPYAGPAMVAMEAMSEMDEHVVMEGGDISDPRYLVTSAVLGGVYAYIERLQLGKFLGETNELALRGALQRGVVQYLKKHPVRAAWNLTAETLSESVQEGLQNGIMGVNEALALEKSLPAAFAEGFIEDFVGSLGTMFVIGVSGHIVGHAARSGWKTGEAGARNRTADYTSALLQAFQENRVEKAGRERMQQFLKEVDGFVDDHYDGWKNGGRTYLKSLGYSPETVEMIDGYLKEDESLADGMHPTEERKADVQMAIVADLMRMHNEARAENGEEWLGKDTGLKEIRDTWAKGNALSKVKVGEDGKAVRDENGLPVFEDDLGAAELQKIGFTKEQAKMLSSVLAHERHQYYARESVEAMRTAYDKATDRQTAPAERLAASLKGGEVVRRDGLTFVRFDVEAGKDAGGKPIMAKASYLVDENADLLDQKPDFTKKDPNVAASIEDGTRGKVTAQQWLDMTPAEREELWERYGLHNRGQFDKRGDFSLVNPETGSEISVETVRELGNFIGRITVNPRPENDNQDNTAIFHENLHGFLRFCRELNVVNADDVAEFVKTFGERRPGVDELFNEEPFADAAESFVLKRRAGSAIADTPANRALAKLFSFGMRIASEGDVRWAERKVAERSAKAATDQIEVTAANKAAAESRFKKVKPAGEGENAKPVSENAKPTSENGKGGSENGELAKTKAIETNDKGEVSFTALTPTGNRKVGGHYEVVPLAELMDSNQPGYPMELQARDRKDNKAEEQTREDHITNFEPGYLLSDPGTDGGAPLVVRQTIDGKPRLVVVSGNGRTMILQALAARHLYDRYRGAMKEWAGANGVAVDVADDANPVLIRVIDDLGGATLKEIADLSNTNAIQQMNEDERARSDAEVIRTLGIAKLYQANVDGSPDMSPGANDEFFAAFQRGVGQNDALYNPDGTLTQAARDRAVRALVAIAVGQGPRGRETVKKLALQADTLGLNRQKNAAAAMAAAVADLERKPEYAIGADVSRAYADYMDFLEQKKAGKVGTLDEYAAQQDMLDRRSEIAEGVLTLIGGSKNAREIAETVKTYCKAAESEDPSGNLFGTARTREQIWRDAEKVAKDAAEGPRFSIGAKALSAMDEIASGKANGKIENAKHGTINYPLGTFGDVTEKGNIGHGLGLLHVVYARMVKERSSLIDAIDVAIGVAESAAEGGETRQTGNRLWLDKNGIRAVVAKNADGKKIITGYEIDADESGVTSRAKPAPSHLPTPRSEDVISALKDRIAQIRRNGNRLSDAIAQTGEKPNKERMARLQARYSFAAAAPISLTGEDIRKAVAKWGTTDDISRGIYCLPDGTMLQGKGTVYTFGGKKIEAFGHDGWVDLILENAPKVDMGTLDGLAEAGGQIEAAQKAIAAAGAIRISGDKNGFAISHEPTPAQYDALYDMAEKAYQQMEANGDEEMYIDVTDENLQTLFTLTYPRGMSARRIIDDLRGWYERGENPAERERSMLAEFHRWSVAPKGVQKGAAIEYPDAADELRTMDDGLDVRWSARIDPEKQKDADAAVESLKNARTAASVENAGAILRESGAVNKPLTNKILGITAKITGNSLSKMTSEKATKNSRSPYLHALAVANADRIFECAFCDATHPDTHGRKEVEKVHRLGSMLHDPKSGMFEPVLVTVIEYKRDGDNVYTLEVVDVGAYKKKNSAGQLVAFADGKRQTPIAEYVGSIAQHVRDFNYAEAVKRGDMATAARMVREAAAKAMPDTKVVGEDGLPLVVYHDTNSKRYVNRETGEDWDLLDWKKRQEWDDRDDWDEYWIEQDFYTFDRRNSRTTNEMPAHFFTPNADPYHEYGSRRIAAFLNLKNPIVNPIIPNRGERDGAGADYMEELRKRGYDGFIREYDGKVDEINAFDSNQIKSADPATYDDAGNLIPLSQRFDQGNADIRFSIGVRRREEFRELIGRKRPDIAPEDVEAYLDEIAGYETAKKQKLAVHWIITGAIELPEDAYKLDKAIATAERAKVDPFQYRSPEDIFASFPQHLPKEKAIDPDTVPELTNKTDLGHGVTVYNVQDDREGQRAMRCIINTHFGKDASPWCLLQGDGDTGELSNQAWYYWQHYSTLPKKVAFLNGRLLAFMATDKKAFLDYDYQSYPDYGIDNELEAAYQEQYHEYEAYLETEEGESEQPRFIEWLYHEHPELMTDEERRKRVSEAWWDRKDASHAGIPIEGKIEGDPLGRSGVRELKDGKLELVGQMWKGDRKNGKYELWNGDYKTLEQEFKDGRPVGWRRTYRLGELSTSEHYNENSEHDLPQLDFYPGVGLARYIEYGEGDHAKLVANFDDDGTIRDFRENGGLSKPAKRAVGFRAKFNEISWTDDAGDYYSVIADEFGRVSSATTIDNLDSGRLWQRREIDAEELESLRAKLEGESAAVLEAVKAEAKRIYDEYSLRDPSETRYSFGRSPRTRAQEDYEIWRSQRRTDEAQRAKEKLPEIESDVFNRFGLTANGLGTEWPKVGRTVAEVYQGNVGQSLASREYQIIDQYKTLVAFQNLAKTDAQLVELESGEFGIENGKLVENMSATGPIHDAICRDLGSVDLKTARTLPGWDAYFGMACRFNGNQPGLYARCFKESAGFYSEVGKRAKAIEAFRKLGEDTGIRGRTVRPSEMGVNVSNEGRVIGATPIEDWFGDNLEGHQMLERLKKAVAGGVNVSQLDNAYRVYKHLPGVAATALERKYAKLLLAACGRVETPWIRDAAREAAKELAQELLTEDVVAKVIADIRANKAETVQMAFRFVKTRFISPSLAVELQNRLVGSGIAVNDVYYPAYSRNAVPIEYRNFKGYMVFVDDFFSPDVGDIVPTVEYAKKDVGSTGTTYLSAFGTKVGNPRFVK